MFTDFGFHLKSGFKKLLCSQMLLFALILVSRKYCVHQFFLYIPNFECNPVTRGLESLESSRYLSSSWEVSLVSLQHFCIGQMLQNESNARCCNKCIYKLMTVHLSVISKEQLIKQIKIIVLKILQ